ncbi:MAG: hypothetical protein JXQ73_02415 [Phycisphaerae bacterium]|nr:hypothetical protein [Phycisphaerae bacterium]
MDRIFLGRDTIILAFFNIALLAAPSSGQTSAAPERVTQRLNQVEQRVNEQERDIDELKRSAASAFYILFLFGVVLSFWAQARGKSGCAWFLLGFIPGVNILAALIALTARRNDTNAQ